MRKVLAGSGWLLLCAACGPPKPVTPALTPQLAGELLHYDNNAKNWLIHVKKQNPGCEYQVTLPAQNNHPTQIDLTHIVWCQGVASPTEFDASVSFEYDPQAQHWVLKRFSS